MKEEYRHGFPKEKRYMLTIINRLGIGSIIVAWGTLLTLKEIGLLNESVSTLPFIFTALGMLLVFGGIYRFRTREKRADTQTLR